jgi:uncharacterized membrane protein YeiB
MYCKAIVGLCVILVVLVVVVFIMVLSPRSRMLNQARYDRRLTRCIEQTGCHGNGTGECAILCEARLLRSIISLRKEGFLFFLGLFIFFWNLDMCWVCEFGEFFGGLELLNWRGWYFGIWICVELVRLVSLRSWNY